MAAKPGTSAALERAGPWWSSSGMPTAVIAARRAWSRASTSASSTSTEHSSEGFGSLDSREIPRAVAVEMDFDVDTDLRITLTAGKYRETNESPSIETIDTAVKVDR